MSTLNQQTQCLDAWNNYASTINLSDSTLRELMRQEDIYWGGLSYDQFVNQWNNNITRPPASTNPGGQTMSMGLTFAGGVSVVNPLPGPEDLIAFGIAVCAVGLAALASMGTVGLALRQPWSFTQNWADDDAVPIPIPLDRTRDREDRGYDLAFGIAEYLPEFSASFERDGERPAPYFWWWAESITTRNGQALMLAVDNIFRAEFDFVLGAYLSQVPDGRFKFNLSGMNNTRPNALTTWELRKLSTTSIYSNRTDYYLFTGYARTELNSVDATIRIAAILES